MIFVYSVNFQVFRKFWLSPGVTGAITKAQRPEAISFGSVQPRGLLRRFAPRHNFQKLAVTCYVLPLI